ncbi:MAG TPA: fused MFS/spermidine synthase [Burkholderiales bacterium]|nr:fused MFS/spermidine synthase [Burkholderiales bacterium]
MLYAATIFLSSFLLFLVQPLIARLILPWFGGSAAVWTTCMLFFQILLVAGYAYAHLLTKTTKKASFLVHAVLLAAAVATLPILPAESWKPQGAGDPTARILLLLGATVGLPYFLLASTSPLVQAWFARARPGANPYRLFAMSNLASLGALVGYPFVVEPVLSAHEQVSVWSWLFGAFAILCASLAWFSRSGEGRTIEPEKSESEPYLLWLSLSATGSVLLLAVTNHLTQNVAAVPLLWLAPLVIYLLSFILTFEGGAWYQPRRLWIVLLVALGGMAWLLADSRLQFQLGLQLGVYLAGLLVACLFCHGELYRARPATGALTAYYLTISIGGALGGLLVAVVAPLVFDAYYELGLGLVMAALLAALRFAPLGPWAGYASLAALLGVAGCAMYEAIDYRRDVRLSERNFYGVLRVKEYGRPGEERYLRRLVHGAIMHGEQYQSERWRRFLTSYYTEYSGIGAAIRSKERAGPIRVGVIGLGAGTIAAYGRKGDVYRFYDINPDVVAVAKREFTFLGDSQAEIQVVLGDARLSLEREAPQNFDVLAVDAFSGDAIPVHLITREALAVYLRQVKPDGIVAFHLSNRFLQLIPVVARLAKEQGVQAALVSDDPDDDDDSLRSRSDWVLVSKSRAALAAPQIVSAGGEPAEDEGDWRTWTDDYSNLVQILKRD